MSSSSSSSSSFSSCSSSSSCSCSSSSSHSCSSSSSYSCSSSSSSYIGFTASKTDVTAGNFEVLAQNGNHLVVNSGVAYDGYGNRLASEDRHKLSLDFSTISENFAYLCIRRRSDPVLIDYQDHPTIVLPKATKREVEIEFYLATNIVKVNFGTGFAYYPALDANDVIDGLVLSKVYEEASAAPEMAPWRSPYMAVKNGTFFPLVGFNVL